MARTKQEVQKILAKPPVSSKAKAKPKTKLEGLAALKVVDLKALAKQYDLPVSGTKATLVGRLEKYQKKGYAKIPEIEAPKKKSPVAKKTAKKTPIKKAPVKKTTVKKTTKKTPLDLTTQEGISTLQVYQDALALMGPDRFVDETLVTMAAVKKEKK